MKIGPNLKTVSRSSFSIHLFSTQSQNNVSTKRVKKSCKQHDSILFTGKGDSVVWDPVHKNIFQSIRINFPCKLVLYFLVSNKISLYHCNRHMVNYMDVSDQPHVRHSSISQDDSWTLNPSSDLLWLTLQRVLRVCFVTVTCSFWRTMWNGHLFYVIL